MRRVSDSVESMGGGEAGAEWPRAPYRGGGMIEDSVPYINFAGTLGCMHSRPPGGDVSGVTAPQARFFLPILSRKPKDPPLRMELAHLQPKKTHRDVRIKQG